MNDVVKYIHRWEHITQQPRDNMSNTTTSAACSLEESQQSMWDDEAQKENFKMPGGMCMLCPNCWTYKNKTKGHCQACSHRSERKFEKDRQRAREVELLKQAERRRVKKCLEGRIVTYLNQVKRGTVLDHAVTGLILDKIAESAFAEVDGIGFERNYE